MATLQDVVERTTPPVPWDEGDNIPWNEPAFSERMLQEHLTQDHDLASRNTALIEAQVAWIHATLLHERPSRILDLACGPGLYLNRFARLGHRGTGIDFSPASIRHARRIAAHEALPVIYEEGDLRSTEFGTGFDLATLVYGQLNVVRRTEAAAIVRRSVDALKPGGVLVVEPQTHKSVRNAGNAGSTWSSHQTGLFAAHPHLLLTESFWNEETSTTTQRFYVVDARNGQVSRHALSTEAYTNHELVALLSEQGLSDISVVGSLSGSSTDDSLNALIGHATG